MAEKKKLGEAAFGAGCFWGVEAEFMNVKGVKETESGFMGGHTKNPSYEEVCSHTTGHAEVVHLKFDPNTVSYGKLLDGFFKIHDPTQLNRQGPDVGFQYRSAIFYYSPEQKKLAEQKIRELEKIKKFSGKIVTAVEPAKEFYRAEEYHQKYL
ncbi:MAG: peptide-methionine (S)-S-oxide reductase MsrA, partial [Candidatus Diapherotrites archaeon]|nr:peptide-methionine (S)-S-oxide reductase MsrA [Candidatus Diapherotrites archaeon]